MSSNQKRSAARRRRLRLADYDYSSPGGYFVTICTHRRRYLFGNIANDTMHQNAFLRLLKHVGTSYLCIIRTQIWMPLF